LLALSLERSSQNVAYWLVLRAANLPANKSAIGTKVHGLIAPPPPFPDEPPLELLLLDELELLEELEDDDEPLLDELELELLDELEEDDDELLLEELEDELLDDELELPPLDEDEEEEELLDEPPVALNTI